MQDESHNIAKPAGVDKEGRRLYLKGGKLLTDDELLAAVEDDYAKDAEKVKLDRELGLVDRRVRSHAPRVLARADNIVLRTPRARGWCRRPSSPTG
jgi:hypothetical protein